MSYAIGNAVTIGKNESNKIVIAHLGVSGEHAIITILSKDELWLQDNNSLNGTYINGLRIDNGIVKSTDKVSLAKNTVDITEQIGKIFKALQSNSVITGAAFQLEIKRLAEIHKKYQADQIAITKKHALKVNVIRSVSAIAVLLGVALLVSHFPIPDAFKIILTGLGTLMGGLVAGGMTAQATLQQLNNQFQIDYVCPSCNGSLGSTVPEVLEKTGHHCKRFKPE